MKRASNHHQAFDSRALAPGFIRLGLLLALGLGACESQFVEFPLDAGHTPDLGLDFGPTADLALPRDLLAGPDLVVRDLAPSPDLLPVADLAVTPDLAITPDFAVLPDFAAIPDFAVTPDLSVTPDLLVLPDLAVIADLLPIRDLSLIPDLTPIVDLLVPADLAVLRTDANPGPVCGAVLFDGLHAVVTAPTQTYLNPAAALTVEAWVYATAYGPNEQVLVAHWGDPALGSASWALRLDATGHPTFAISKLGTDTTLVATAVTPVQLNQWTHVAGVFSPSLHAMYAFANGSGSGFAAAPGVVAPFAINNTALSVGRYSFATPVERPFIGYIDSPRISSVARYTADFVPQAHYLTDVDTIALYRFDETMGQTAADVTAHANVATLEQNAVFANPPSCRPTTPVGDGG